MQEADPVFHALTRGWPHGLRWEEPTSPGYPFRKSVCAAASGSSVCRYPEVTNPLKSNQRLSCHAPWKGALANKLWRLNNISSLGWPYKEPAFSPHIPFQLRAPNCAEGSRWASPLNGVVWSLVYLNCSFYYSSFLLTKCGCLAIFSSCSLSIFILCCQFPFFICCHFPF